MSRLIAFNHQNVVFALTIEEHEGRNKLIVSPSFGLGGEFFFREADVLEAEFLD
jgi:hypothetical protein